MKVLAGDWPPGAIAALRQTIWGTTQCLVIETRAFKHEKIQLDQIAGAELVTEDNRMSVGAKLGWGTAGLLLAGPIGAVIGGVAGGNKRDRVVAVAFKDGRKAVLKCNKSEADQLMALSYQWAVSE